MKKCPCDMPKKASKGTVPSRDGVGRYACGGPVKAKKMPPFKGKK